MAKGVLPHTKEERALKAKGYKLIAGIDEAGRGPLAGPVVAACVILPFHRKIKGVKDSKLMTAKAREKAYEEILGKCHDFGVGIVDHEIINTIGIYKATKLAMERAVQDLKKVAPDHLLIDAMAIGAEIEQKAIIKGDLTCYSIAAASVLAKVVRDDIMREYHKLYPDYRFDLHKGYSTKLHQAKLKEHGPCPIHRVNYEPVRLVARAKG